MSGMSTASCPVSASPKQLEPSHAWPDKSSYGVVRNEASKLNHGLETCLWPFRIQAMTKSDPNLIKLQKIWDLNIRTR